MAERQWILGEDVSEYDSLLDGFTFNQLIVSLHSGSEKVNPKEVRKVVKDMLESQLEDMWFLVERNMEKRDRRLKPNRGQRKPRSRNLKRRSKERKRQSPSTTKRSCTSIDQPITRLSLSPWQRNCQSILGCHTRSMDRLGSKQKRAYISARTRKEESQSSRRSA